MRKVSVLLTEQDEARLSAFCFANGHKKSTLIAKLVRDHLDQQDVTLARNLHMRDRHSRDCK